MTKRLDPAIKFQHAEERWCECGAAGSGEGHAKFCPWLKKKTAVKRALFGGKQQDASRKALGRE